MRSTWDNILKKYIHNLVSPDGRNTFESTPELVKAILQKAKITSNDTVIDIGCGWGNLTREIATYSAHTIGIEPDLNNLNSAKSIKTAYSIEYLQGAFESLNCSQKIDVVVSSLAFHQVKYSYKTTALKNVKNLLNKNGRFVLCDTMILFDAENEPEFFDMVYRYLFEKTTPAEIYKNHIAPYLQKDYIYTWDDMKRYTPKDNWFYSLAELKEWLAECSLMVVDQSELCPFFGIITIEHFK